MRSIVSRFGFLGICTAAAAAMSIPSVVALLKHSHPNWYYTHIPAIPVISAIGLLWRVKKRKLPAAVRPFWPGSLIMAAGLGLYAFGRPGAAALNPYAFVSVSAALTFWWGAFLTILGPRSFRNARFPLVFLVFAVPLPMIVLDGIIGALVVASTFVTGLIFSVLGVPYYQDGAVFYLPGFGLKVAEECSGIRSTLALLITSVLAGQMFLRGPARKVILALAVFPVSILKNGIRIVVLYMLSYFVDMRIIDGGFLHRSGGFLFFGLGLIALAGVLWALKDGPRSKSRPG